MNELTGNVQIGPWPTELVDLVSGCQYRPNWTVELYKDFIRDPSDTYRGESKGLTLVIQTSTINSYEPHGLMIVNHIFAVPPSTYNRESWQWWLFERFLSVERHECMEFFTIDGEKPYAPNHAPGWDPYLITVVATDADRRTNFRGEIKEPAPSRHYTDE